MDEQHDQAVLETKEIETDADYDYLSILREMQDSLSADQESPFVQDAASNNSEITEITIDKVFDAQIVENELPLPLVEHFSANGDSNGFAEENLEAADYLANAKTQPLPELLPDFNSNLTLDNLDNSAAIETNLNNFPAVPADNLFASETVIAADEADDQDNFEIPGFPQNGLAVQFHDHSFHDFAEMSPILFDSSEQFEIAEPNLEAGFSGEATNEATTEIAMETSQTSTAPDNLAEATADELFGIADEMPINLAFGEMFAEDSANQFAAPVAETPPLEINEETEAEITTLLAGLEELESSNFALPTTAPDEFAQPVLAASPTQLEQPAEQNFEEDDLTANTPSDLETQDVIAVSDHAFDFGLPEAMLLRENVDNVAPEPVFAALDDEIEPTFETIEEPFLWQDPPAQGFESQPLAVPSFLQAEVNLTKQSAASESLPATENLVEKFVDNIAQEDATSELRSLAHNILHAAPPLDSTDATPQQIFPVDSASNTVSELLLADFTVADKAPEPALIKKTVTDQEETDYSNDFAKSDSVALLANEFENSSPDFPTEMPEYLLFDTFETELPEVDFAEFDLQPPPANQSFSAAAVLPDSKQNSAASSVVQEMSDLPKSVSFLKERFVIFKLDDTLYAFPAVNVAEIGQLLPITPLPFVPSWFLGISNLRGEILSVVGLRELWEKNAASPHKAKILVVRSEKQALTVGLVVDAVREMRHVTPEEIFSDDSNSESHFAPYRIGMVEYEGQNLCLLNAEKLLETLRS